MEEIEVHFWLKKQADYEFTQKDQSSLSGWQFFPSRLDLTSIRALALVSQ